MWRMLSRVPIGLLLSFPLLFPASGRAHEPEPVSPKAARAAAAQRNKIAYADGRDVVFAARYYRKSGTFYRDWQHPHVPHGNPSDETLDPVSQHLYTIRPNGAGLRQITFGAMECDTPRWSPDGTRIVFVGDGSLYLVNADGSGRVRLTSGAADLHPQWSPDGEAVMFMRDVVKPDVLRDMNNPGRSSLAQICLVMVPRAGGKQDAPRKICVPPAELQGPDKFAFSPDGRWIAVQAGGKYISAAPMLFLFDRLDGKTREYPHVGAFAWAPDSRRLYLTGSGGIDRILDVDAGTMTTVRHPVLGAVWRGDSRIVGLMNPQHSIEFVAAGENTVRTVSASGALLTESPLKRGDPFAPASAAAMKTPDSGISGDYDCVWHPLPSRSGLPPRAILEGEHHMTDGEHFCCYEVNLASGVFRDLPEGEYFCRSPDGRQYLTEDTDWVGPYKRGGARVGPLQIVDVRTGKARSLTRRMTVIHGVDWRGGIAR